MDELRGVEYLRRKLESKEKRVRTRYKFYDMKNAIKDFEISTPPELTTWKISLGWCAKAVDSIGDRLEFREFTFDNFDINEIYNQNNPDILFDSAMQSALIASCSFVYISTGNNGFPRLQVLSAYDATGIIDTTTYLLKEGYAVLQRDHSGNIVSDAYFGPGFVDYYENGRVRRYSTGINIPLLVPIIYKPDASRPFGHSRISRSCMDIVGGAMRTVKRSEVAAEFFSFPQKYVVGTSQDREPMDKWKASMSAMMEFTKDEEGDSPKLGQFEQQSMAPHLDQMRMFAGMFAGETGLTLDDLGFPSDNPSSQEAIKASHENLRLRARKAQKNFRIGFLNAGYVAACIRDKVDYERSELYLTKALWEPIFEPDAATLSSIGDGAIKINQAVPGYFGPDNLRNMTGISPSENPVPIKKEE